jgi:hypothetical protein
VRVHALYKWFPDAKRALPNGGRIAVCCHWNPADPCGPVKSVPYRRLLLTPTFLRCCLGLLGYLLSLTWFTPFIVDGLGYSQAIAGTALPWVAVLSTGWGIAGSDERRCADALARGVFGSVRLYGRTHAACNPFCRNSISEDGADQIKRSNRVRFSAWHYCEAPKKRGAILINAHATLYGFHLGARQQMAPAGEAEGLPYSGATRLPSGWQMTVVTFPFLPALAAAHLCSSVYDTQFMNLILGSGDLA